jgi:hypothetical protein
VTQLEYVQDEDGNLFVQDEDGDLYGITNQGTLIDADGDELVPGEDGALYYAQDATDQEAWQEFAANAQALDKSLPRRLTANEQRGIIDAAERLGTTDAKEAYERWLEENNKPHPSKEDDDQQAEALADRYEDIRGDLRDNDPEGVAATDAARADSGGGE